MWMLVSRSKIMNSVARYFQVCPILLSAFGAPSSAPAFRVSAPVQLSYDLSNKPVPRWTGGVFVVIDSNGTSAPVIRSFGSDGRELTPVVITIPDAQIVKIWSAARGNDGLFAVAATAYDREGRGGGLIGLRSADGMKLTIIKLFPYVPHTVAIAPDNTIWTQGIELVNGSEHAPEIDPNRGMLRHFDTEGRQIAAFIPRNEVRLPNTGTGYLLATRTIVGWYPSQGQAYFEVKSDGTTVRYPGAPGTDKTNVFVTGFALTDSGKALVSVITLATNENDRTTHAVYRLDRPTRTWAPVNFPGIQSSEITYLYGSDSNRVVLKTRRTVNGFHIVEVQ